MGVGRRRRGRGRGKRGRSSWGRGRRRGWGGHGEEGRAPGRGRCRLGASHMGASRWRRVSQQAARAEGAGPRPEGTGRKGGGASRAGEAAMAQEAGVGSRLEEALWLKSFIRPGSKAPRKMKARRRTRKIEEEAAGACKTKKKYNGGEAEGRGIERGREKRATWPAPPAPLPASFNTFRIPPLG